MTTIVKLPKIVGCLLCGYRTDKPREIMLFQSNGCQCKEIHGVDSDFRVVQL